MSRNNLAYRPDIDGLRAIAVMSVLFYHALPNFFRSGYIGVDIFFVISGFLITTIIRKELIRGDFSLASFYKKRIRRIYPALIITILGVLFLSWFLLSTSEFSITLKHVIFSSLFTENFLLWSEDGYFDKASIFKPTLHIWSLSIEEQFYIFWPFIIAFFVKRKIEVKGILFFIIASFCINVYDISNNPAAAYYSPLGRSWELMVGSLLSVIYTDKTIKDLNPKVRGGLALCGLIIVLLSIFLIPSQKLFPGFYAIPVVLGSALIIFFSENTIVGKWLSIKSVVFIGLISYPLYLVHWPLMSFASILIGRASDKANVLCIIASLVIAVGIYSIIEKPIHRKKLSVSYQLFFAMIAIPLLSFYLMGSKSRINEMVLPSESEWSFLKANHEKFGLHEFNNNGTGIYTMMPKPDNSYVFIGDSHIANLAEYIDDRLNNTSNPPGVVIAAGGGCIPIKNVYTDDQRRKSCWDMRDSAYQKIKDSGVKNVVIGGAWYMYFFSKKDYFYKDDSGKFSINSENGMNLAISSLMTTIKELTKMGKNVYFIKDAPYITDVFPGIYRMRLQPLLSYNPHETVSVSMDRDQVDFIGTLASKAQSSGAQIINIYDKVCGSETCKLTDNGEFMYADAGHFNPSWLRKNKNILGDIKL
ncbi:acyltransferase family protein [Erwinia sp. SLM-02]|uniref:acyltransferase family protein n=1 Tax=Erwinia sp. SLM-02 TaxID=3020057 RepID=UPI0030807CA6